MRRASLDPRLDVVVRAPRSLHYHEGEDRDLDRPAHVRAASSAAFIGGRLAIVQDDANFIALVDPHNPIVTSYALDHGEGGLRQFDDVRGNKKHKLDLEACVVVGDQLIAFGSGSTPAREKILCARSLDTVPDVRLIDARALYATLRAETAFAGSELNIEGVARIGDRLRLFNRGNGAPHGALLPVDATCDVSADALLAHLEGGPLPTIDSIVQYDLGDIDGVRLGFTDAVMTDRLFYLAAAEDSPDAVRDGPVAGVAIGLLDELRYARVRTESGPFDGKAEGIAFDPKDPRRGWLVVDRDDPGAAGELWEFELIGPW